MSCRVQQLAILPRTGGLFDPDREIVMRLVVVVVAVVGGLPVGRRPFVDCSATMRQTLLTTLNNNALVFCLPGRGCEIIRWDLGKLWVCLAARPPAVEGACAGPLHRFLRTYTNYKHGMDGEVGIRRCLFSTLSSARFVVWGALA